MKTLKIFLTGATGFVGAQLINRLLQDEQHELYVLYRDEHRKNKLITEQNKYRLHFIQGDITLPNFGVDAEIIDQLPPMDYFYHLAALVKFDEDLREDLFKINYEGTKNALDFAQAINTQHFLYVSTAYTVGINEDAKEVLHDIHAETNNPYEESKVKAEHLVAASSMKTSILRPAIIIGDSVTGAADSKFTMYGFMKALKVFKRKMDRNANHQHLTYRLFVDDNCTSNLVPVDYVVKVLAHAIPHAEDKTIYHITNNEPPENLAVLSMIKKYLNFDQLTVAPTSEKHTMNDQEAILNGYIEVFEPYFKKSVVFDETNTKAMLSKASENTLTLTPEQLEHIIAVFFK
ncbi:SDR family oxidoreductase [Macrococcus capreoli]|uniref:SDR family oxidoreductase n=1 Tax=Macrococcus capreoli TaxID=2982690 RepID=UPI0021D5D616|nr:SDR family oxidoreductase [Macrococcus sp. TMW 2.2395]MCU7556988.1 SDR family oxidoreductase [Macrococcus sp. TMW 2.2395]